MLITGSRVYTTTLPAQFAPSGSVHIAPAASAPVVTAAWLHIDFDASHRKLVGGTSPRRILDATGSGDVHLQLFIAAGPGPAMSFTSTCDMPVP